MVGYNWNVANKTMGDDYKLVEVTATSVSPAVGSAISGLFDQHDPRDIYYQMDGHKIRIYVHSLDLVNFTSVAKHIKNSYNNKQITHLINDIVENIQTIGSYGIKGGKRLYVGYNSERKVKDRKLKEGTRRYTRRASVNIVSNTLPETYENRIICGDSLKVLRKLPDNCVDLIFTSPPYNFGLEYESNGDAHKWDKYFEQLFAIFDEGIRVLKHGGRFVINIQPLFSDYIPSHHIISNHFLKRGLLWKGEILWEKNNYNCKYTAWGSWKSPSSPYLKYTWEFVEVFAKGTLKKEGESKNADISGDEFKKWVVAKWSIAPERKMKLFDHPAMFPEELAERVIKLFSFKNDIVVDPFNGVGTTTVVAQKLKRKYLGIDLSKKYCNTAKKRMQENTSP